MNSRLETRIDQGTGREPADMVLKGGRFFDLVTGELVATDIAICGDTIVGTCENYKGIRKSTFPERSSFRVSSIHISTSDRRW